MPKSMIYPHFDCMSYTDFAKRRVNGANAQIHIKMGIRVKKVPFVKCTFVLPKMPVKCFQLLKKMLMKHF